MSHHARNWFNDVLVMTEHDKALGRSQKLGLALSKVMICKQYLYTNVRWELSEWEANSRLLTSRLLLFNSNGTSEVSA